MDIALMVLVVLVALVVLPFGADPRLDAVARRRRFLG